jgi:uncharacterized protein YbaP (TraB family)
MRRILAALTAVLALAFGAGRAMADPPMWIVHGPKSTMVLFGSIHLLPVGLEWRPAALDAWLGRTDELWFELPIDSNTDSQAAELSQTRGMLPQNGSLLAKLSPSDAERLRRVSERLNRSVPAIDEMRPWLAEVTLSIAMDAADGADASSGVEEQIQAIVPVTVKRRALETAKQQIDFLAGADEQEQIASLSETLREIEDEPGDYRRVVDDWLAGNVAALERDALDPQRHASQAMFDRLITDRNRRWAKALKARLKHPGVVVVVVGVGHLVGKEGLPAQLRGMGFEVDGPTVSPALAAPVASTR